MYFVELKLAVSLAVLPSTESLKIVIITLYCSLLITIHYYGHEKNYNVVFNHNVMEMGLKLGE